MKTTNWLAGLVVVALIALAIGCDRGEDRPTVEIIDGGTGSVSVSGTGTGSVSGTGTGTGSVSGTAAATGDVAGTEVETGETGGLRIPTGLDAETSGPSKSDGYFNPTTNREIYQKISTDYQEILKLTNVVNQGMPLPAAEIWLLYEAGYHTRLGPQSRTLRSFAAGSTPARFFPDAAEFYGSGTFLDSPIQNAVRMRGEAESYTDAQRRQAIGKGLLRVLYHWAKFYMIIGGERMRSGLVDEAWAVYVGEEVDGAYPNSLAAVAQAREGNFGRQGTIDVPLRQAMERARQAADGGDEAVFEAAARDVYSRFNAIFYLSTVRYIGRVMDDAEAGNHDALGTHQVEALAFYQSIQPEVAKADPAADKTIMAYLESAPVGITTASRDAALASPQRDGFRAAAGAERPGRQVRGRYRRRVQRRARHRIPASWTCPGACSFPWDRMPRRAAPPSPTATSTRPPTGRYTRRYPRTTRRSPR